MSLLTRARVAAVAGALAAVVVGTAVLATDPPHYSTNTIECLDCHTPHTAPGGKLNITEDNPNVCMSCHTSGGLASGRPFLASQQAKPGTSGTTHRFDSGPQGWVEPTVTNTSPGKVKAGGAFTGRIECDYTITIAAVPGNANVGTAKFNWSDNCWPTGGSGMGVTTGTNIALSRGVTATFQNGSPTPSFKVGDSWKIRVRTDLRLPSAAVPAEAPLAAALDAGRVSCSTCHNQHSQENQPADLAAPAYAGAGTGWGRHYQRIPNDQNQMCRTCHSPRDVTTSAAGSHPINVNIPGNSTFRAPPNLELIGGKVLCTTCHTPHFASSGGANAGGGDGYLLDDSIGELCSECHLNANRAGGSHFNTTSGLLWPGGQYGSSFPAHTNDKKGFCINCHWPHGWPDNVTPANDYAKLWVERYDNDKTTRTDPADAEDLCFTCHDGAPAQSNPRADFLLGTSTTPIITTTPSPIFHHPINDLEQQADNTRIVECVSCHNPHRATPGDRHAGVSGKDIANNDVGYGTANDRALKQYELCFKCHGPTFNAARDKRPYPSGSILAYVATDKRLDFQPTNSAFHPIVTPGQNQSPNLATQLSGAGLDTTSKIRCSDCHASSAVPDADRGVVDDTTDVTVGPHGSANQYILRATYSRDYRGSGNQWENPITNADLCFRCHLKTALLGSASNWYDRSGNGRGPLHQYHLSTKDVTNSCSSCHFNVHSNRTASNTRYRVVNGATVLYDSNTPPAAYQTHLINFAPDVAVEASRPALPGGVTNSPTWQINLNTGTRTCWVVCHGKDMPGFNYSAQTPGNDVPGVWGASPTAGLTRACGTDADNDGSWTSAVANCQPNGLAIADCADNDATRSPDKAENSVATCGDGKDNDCDGTTDCSDAGCPGVGACAAGCVDVDGDGVRTTSPCSTPIDCDDTSAARAPNKPENTSPLCGDGIDNDCDARVDCRDPNCSSFAFCCTDDDLDGFFQESNCGTTSDCDDANPLVRPVGAEAGLCTDGKDNDCDGKADCHDTDCWSSAACQTARECCVVGTTKMACYLSACNGRNCEQTSCDAY